MLNNASREQDLRADRLSVPAALSVLLAVIVAGLMHSTEEGAAAYESFAFSAGAHAFHEADGAPAGENPAIGKPPDDHYDENERRSLHTVRVQALKLPFR